MFNNELPLTPAQKRRRRAIEKKMQKALRELRDLAVEAGCSEPSLFYEVEGVLCVFDLTRGHPGEGSCNVRQDKVALSVTIYSRNPPTGILLDCGGW
jgi:hypothetical protein